MMVALGVSGAVPCALSGADILVDPAAGRPVRNGTAATLVLSSVHAAWETAQRLLRTRPHGVGVHITLAPGVHDLGAQPLVLSSGAATGGGGVRWASVDPADPAVFSAGVRVTGWRPHPTEPGVLVAPIPAVVPRGTVLRHLWVGGMRASKPRYYPRCPTGNCGQHSELSIVENSSVSSEPWAWPWGGYRFNASAIDPSTLRNPQHVEFVFTGRAGARGRPPSGARDDQSGEDPWTEMRCTIEDVRGRSVVLQRACWRALPFAGAEDTGGRCPSAGTRCPRHQVPAYLENVEANFTSPGQWYLDSAGGLVLYRPRSGESVEAVETSAFTARNSTLL
jgi:hypothetical protein